MVKSFTRNGKANAGKHSRKDTSLNREMATYRSPSQEYIDSKGKRTTDQKETSLENLEKLLCYHLLTSCLNKCCCNSGQHHTVPVYYCEPGCRCLLKIFFSHKKKKLIIVVQALVYQVKLSKYALVCKGNIHSYIICIFLHFTYRFPAKQEHLRL